MNTVAGSDYSARVGVADVSQTWERLADEPDSCLIDVRTRAEWAFVGVPDLSAIGRRVLFVEWQRFPQGDFNPQFTETLRSELDAMSATPDTALYFICRSGGRSLAAAGAMLQAGYRVCINVEGGFEGPLDTEKHRGRMGGWKAAGLPWLQG